MTVTETQMPQAFRQVIQEQIDLFKQTRSIQVRNSIPDTSEIPLDNQLHWLRIPDVICVYVDMMNSTKLSAATQDTKTAGPYQLFTGTAVRLFSAFNAPYIDVRGDGVFALFDQETPYRAISAAVTFKTFAKEEFVPRAKELTAAEVGAPHRHRSKDCTRTQDRTATGRRQNGQTK